MTTEAEAASLRKLLAKTPDDPWAKPMLEQKLVELETEIGSMKEVNQFKEFKARLQRVANKNGDEFAATVTWDEYGYHLQVIETADSHVFIEVSAPTLTEVIEKANAQIPDACKSWGYDSVP